jgi:hypothetical protein
MTMDRSLLNVNYTHLTRHSDLSMMLEPYWTLGAVRIVKNDGYAGLGNASLPTFVDEVLLVGCTHLHYTMIGIHWHSMKRTYGSHICDTENETYRVKDVGLA